MYTVKCKTVALLVSFLPALAPFAAQAVSARNAVQFQRAPVAGFQLAQQQPYLPPYPPVAPSGAAAGSPPPITIPPAAGGAMPQQNTQPYPPAGALPAPYPPAPPPYPTAGQQPVPGARAIVPGSSFGDAMGRFRVTLPQGAQAMGSSYSFAVPNAGIMVNLNCNANDQDFQNAMQAFPATLQQAGLKSAQGTINFRGRQLQMITVYHGIVQNTTLSSLNVFVPGPNVWIQVLGADQAEQQLAQGLQVVLDGLQY